MRKNHFTLIWLGERRHDLEMPRWLLGLAAGVFVFMTCFSAYACFQLDTSPLQNYKQVGSENQLLHTKTYLLYQKNRDLAKKDAVLAQKIKLLEAMISAENAEVFHLNPDYQNITLEENTIGWRVIQYKLKIGERPLYEYTADRLHPKDHQALQARLEQIQQNIEKLIQTKQFAPSIKIVETADQEYIGLAGDLIVLAVTKKDALHLQTNGRAIAENQCKILLKELKIAKENKILQETPLVGSVKIVKPNGGLENILQQIDFCQQFNRNILNKNNELIAVTYAKAMDFKTNYARTPSIYPTRRMEISSPYGYRIHPITNAGSIHYGLDIAVEPGNKVLATADGRVTYTGWIGGYGIAVQIHHGMGLSTLYGHCDSILVRKGDYVRKSQVIALSGNSGLSAGPHLHYEIRRWNVAIDPAPYLDRDIFAASKDWGK
ncbi:peptidase family M23 [Candidatus Termititenax persephonae]|uniref:Peptidase family M23 n=1 Tax=Candidatus Termititenax persephonae TaxID=2218525 RepID=A0A388THB5_9BACT|nr:peptidase family M23 [Candidatus Termititenax persephonae]